jgi:hypothetical protein
MLPIPCQRNVPRAARCARKTVIRAHADADARGPADVCFVCLGGTLARQKELQIGVPRWRMARRERYREIVGSVRAAFDGLTGGY